MCRRWETVGSFRLGEVKKTWVGRHNGVLRRTGRDNYFKLGSLEAEPEMRFI